MVDECPVEDNLFSGVIRVSCFIRPRVVPNIDEDDNRPLQLEADCDNSTEIRCHESGCSASGYVRPCRLPTEGQQCFLNLKIWQTDFDGDHGSVEVVEWVKLNGEEIATDLKPGRNPCKEVMLEGATPNHASIDEQILAMDTEDGLGVETHARAMVAQVPGEDAPSVPCRRRVMRMNSSTLQSLQPTDNLPSHRRRGSIPYQNYNHLRAAPDEPFEIIESRDVTEQIRNDGEVFVEGKISRMVDECGKDGYLFNSVATIECK